MDVAETGIIKRTGFGTFFWAFLIMLCATTVAAQNKSVPEDLLALDHQRCMNGCIPGFGEDTCKPLCDCTVGEFRKQLTFEEYLDMSVQLSRNEVAPGMREFLDKVANFCTAELDRLGIVIGDGTAAPEPKPESK